jgi:hypothetical protein
MSSDKRKEFLIQFLDKYASRPDADYEIAKRLFDLRWAHEDLTPGQLSDWLREIRAQQRDDGFTVVTPKGIARVPREVAVHLAEFATVESEVVTQSQKAPPVEPPRLAEFGLSLFLKGDKADALTGDLNERFEQDCQRYGAKRARRIYWGRALRSLWPLLRRAAARAIKWGVIIDNVWRHF